MLITENYVHEILIIKTRVQPCLPSEGDSVSGAPCVSAAPDSAEAPAGGAGGGPLQRQPAAQPELQRGFGIQT